MCLIFHEFTTNFFIIIWIFFQIIKPVYVLANGQVYAPFYNCRNPKAFNISIKGVRNSN